MTATQARSWPELFAVHDRFVEDYNAQRHRTHRHREDGRRLPAEVLGWVMGLRYRPEDLERAFFASCFSRVLAALGYATFRRSPLYGEEALVVKRPPRGCTPAGSPWSTRPRRSLATTWSVRPARTD